MSSTWTQINHFFDKPALDNDGKPYINNTDFAILKQLCANARSEHEALKAKSEYTQETMDELAVIWKRGLAAANANKDVAEAASAKLRWALEDIAEETDADNPLSCRNNDEGDCLGWVYAKATAALDANRRDAS